MTTTEGLVKRASGRTFDGSNGRNQAASANLRNERPAEAEGTQFNQPAKPFFLLLSVLAFAIKLLFLPAPHSTDLEVHRHWKALTFNLPLSQWYTDESSQWTLDYPPLFAFFEAALARLLAPLDANIVSLSAHNYAAPRAVSLMRLSVLLVDPLFAFATYTLLSSIYSNDRPQRSSPSSSAPVSYPMLRAAALILLSPGLILVDNVHFQYNALPLALLLFSLSFLGRGCVALAALCFALTVNTKHTLLPLAPALGLHALQTLWSARRRSSFVVAVARTSAGCAGALVAPWVPFYNAGRGALLSMMMRRLAPFDRGLLHANWAPNVWAAAATLDRLLVMCGVRLREPDGGTTTGIIGAQRPFAVLPNPTPAVCTLLSLPLCLPVYKTVMAQMPPFTDNESERDDEAYEDHRSDITEEKGGREKNEEQKEQEKERVADAESENEIEEFISEEQISVRRRSSTDGIEETNVGRSRKRKEQRGKKRRDKVRTVVATAVLAGLAAFLTGWHVHEKNILVALIPLGAIAPTNREAAMAFLLLASAAHLAILDLVARGAAATASRLSVIGYHVFAYAILQDILLVKERGKGQEPGQRWGQVGQWGKGREAVMLYMIGTSVIELYGAEGHEWLLGGRLPFLPTMGASVYGFCGVAAAFMLLAGELMSWTWLGRQAQDDSQVR